MTKPLLMPALLIGRDRLTQRRWRWRAGPRGVARGRRTAFTAGLAAFLAGHRGSSRYASVEGHRLVRRDPQLALPYVAAGSG